MTTQRITPGQQPLACVLVEGDRLTRERYERALSEAGVETEAAARSGVQALLLLEGRPTTVLVLDADLTDVGVLDLARRAAEIARRKLAVVVSMSRADPELVMRALDTGARAVIRKDAQPATLRDALAAVAADRIFVDPELSSDLESDAT